jgi:small-conductance mechanosensitive channel
MKSFKKIVILFLLPITLCFIEVKESKAQNEIIPTDTVELTDSTRIDNLLQDSTLFSTKVDTSVVKINPPSLADIVSGPKILWTIFLLILGYIFIRLSISLLNSYAKRIPKYNLLFKRILPIFRIISWTFIVYIIVVGVLKPPMATLIAFFASIGVAIGFAAQDLVKNFFGGLVVMFDRPFQIGDKVEASGEYGEVIEIGIGSTKIVTPDDSIVTIPNSDFMSQKVSNSNAGENNCQVTAELFLPLDIDTEKVRKIAIEAAQISKYIYLNKPIAVLFFNEMHHTRSVYKMKLKAYVSDLSKEFAFKSEMTEIVIKTLIEEKILIEDL